MPKSTNTPKCAGTTAKQRPCSRTVSNGSTYCSSHRSQASQQSTRSTPPVPAHYNPESSTTESSSPPDLLGRESPELPELSSTSLSLPPAATTRRTRFVGMTFNVAPTSSPSRELSHFVQMPRKAWNPDEGSPETKKQIRGCRVVACLLLTSIRNKLSGPPCRDRSVRVL